MPRSMGWRGIIGTALARVLGVMSSSFFPVTLPHNKPSKVEALSKLGSMELCEFGGRVGSCFVFPILQDQDNESS